MARRRLLTNIDSCGSDTLIETECWKCYIEKERLIREDTSASWIVEVDNAKAAKEIDRPTPSRL